MAPDRIGLLNLIALAMANTGDGRTAAVAKLQFRCLDGGADPEWIAYQIGCAISSGKAVGSDYVGPTWCPVEQLLITALGRDSRPATLA